MRGLESLSQLIVYDFDKEAYVISSTPIQITDSPRYKHRGMLLDTSRHFQPIPMLKLTIDSLAYAKYNVQHWHVVDTQSFPFQSKLNFLRTFNLNLSSKNHLIHSKLGFTYPKLWNGAYTSQEKYSQDDIKELVECGRLRDVRIMIELDMPGHAASWCVGYPGKLI